MMAREQSFRIIRSLHTEQLGIVRFTPEARLPIRLVVIRFILTSQIHSVSQHRSASVSDLASYYHTGNSYQYY